VYVIDDNGVPKRDIRIENNEKILDIKKGANQDNIENVNYMPNLKYNTE
jgi:urease alpha subunit